MLFQRKLRYSFNSVNPIFAYQVHFKSAYILKISICQFAFFNVHNDKRHSEIKVCWGNLTPNLKMKDFIATYRGFCLSYVDVSFLLVNQNLQSYH